MSETKKIYIVTSGCYSDYSINAVFSTRELAEEYIDAGNGYEDADIEEYNLDEPIKRKTRVLFVSMMLADKKVRHVSDNNPPMWKDVVKFDKTRSGEPYLLFAIESDSRERAIKIASERFGAVIANEQTFYPYLRACIVNYAGCKPEYPPYNFKNGNIVLMCNRQFVTEMPEWVKWERRFKDWKEE